MTENTVQYGQPQDPVSYDQLPPDARWLIYAALDIEAMDGILADLVEEWAAKFADHFEASQVLSTAKDGLAAVENGLMADPTLEPRVTAKSAGEREKQRKAIIETNPVWLEVNEELREATYAKARLEHELEELDKRMGVLKARLAWRSRTVGLLTSMPRMETDQLPTVEHPLPPAMDNRVADEVQFGPEVKEVLDAAVADGSLPEEPPWVSL